MSVALPAAAAGFSFVPPPPGQMITGHFVQTFASGQRATGKFWLAANSARWEQVAPHEMMLISSGGMAWQVEPDLNQAVLHRLGDEDLFTALQGAALRTEPSKPGVFKGELKGVGMVDVHMTPGTPMPSMVVQHDEGLTTMFSHVRQVRMDPALFRYSPPPGMDVIR